MKIKFIFPLTLLVIFLQCGGGGGIINLSFPTILTLNPEAKVLAVGDPYEGKVNLIELSTEKRIKELSYRSGIQIATYQSGFLIFLPEGNETAIKSITITGSTVVEENKETIPRMLTGLYESKGEIWFSTFKEGYSEIWLYPEVITTVNGICALAGVIEGEIFLRCEGNTLISINNSNSHTYTIPEASLLFPDPISRTLIITEGQKISILDKVTGEIKYIGEIGGSVLSFLPFKDRWVFLDILGYARIIRRTNGCEIKNSFAQVTESSGNITVENLKIDDCTAKTAEWKLEFEGELPQFPRTGFLSKENTLYDKGIDFTQAGIKNGDTLMISSPFEGEFEINSFTAHTITIAGTFPKFNVEATYSVRVKGLLLTKDEQPVEKRLQPGDTFSSPEFSFTVSPSSSPARGDYLIIYTYEYGENMPFFVNNYPVAATYRSDTEVFVLNPLEGEITEVNFKDMKVKRSFK